MASLESVLNTIIPWAIGILGVYLLYRPLKVPIDSFFRMIANSLRWTKSKVSGEQNNEFEHEYLDYE